MSPGPLTIVAVNIGRPEHVAGHRALTGINKRPVAGPVAIGPLGLADDAVLDLEHHGGPDQAVYLYGLPDYAHFEHVLGHPLPPGLFGENLTIAGLESAGVNIGDRFAIGAVLLEASAPRNPCATFAARMGDAHWVKRFHAAQRPGVYARVLSPGSVAAGMTVTHVPFAGTRVPITELTADYKKPSRERMRYLLEAPIHRDLVEQYRAALAQDDLLA
ncbi:MAG: MOSC domain-containing protein [Devosia sp.]|nr:MOSC domain-containing protein [Devosia sp.]